MKNAWLSVALVSLAGCNCGGRLVSSGGGTLRVTLISADPRAALLQVVAHRTASDSRDVTDPIDTLPKVLTLEDLPAGTYLVRVTARDAVKKQLQSVWVTDVEVLTKKVTEIIIDLSTGVPGPTEVCDGVDNDGDGDVDEGVDLAVCAECKDGIEALLTDDPRCGTIRCDGLTHTELRGDNTAAGTSTCVRVAFADLTANRCQTIGHCATANGPKCTSSTETTLATAGLCQTISACGGGSPVVVTSPDGTSCGGARICRSGACVLPGTDAGVDAGVDPIGCSDGTREGFQSLTTYPAIAGCSGAWTVPGVTRANLAPTCSRGSGNSSANTEGTGCAAADLCSAGWHVCNGKDEVAQNATSCTDAVPPGTLDKMLFFAVAQASQNGSVCGATGDNDVFGCGNLGALLVPGKMCGVLTRVLASTQADSCGYNEAEPTLGPWQCIGGAGSDLHEGANVTKKGCPGTSCSYSGSPVGNSDKGGVLCCRD